MLATPSVARNYSLVFSGDPALARPVRVEDEDEAGAKAWEARLAEWRQALDVAQKTGDWSSVLKPGEVPTMFRFQQVPGDVWATMQRLFGPLGILERCTLMVRVALVGIENGPEGHTVQFEPHVDHLGRVTGLGQVVTAATTNLLDTITIPSLGVRRGDVLLELGNTVFERRAGLGPLS